VGAGIFVSGVVDMAGVRFDPVVMRNMLYIYLKHGGAQFDPAKGRVYQGVRG
jgi:hypothetical protein